MTADSPHRRGGDDPWRAEDLTGVRLASPGYLRKQLQRFDLHLRRGRGQHFLVDRNHLAAILNTAAVSPGDLVLEIGAGLGTMTQALALCGADVLAVEVDAGLAAAARELLSQRDGVRGSVRILEGDALEVDVGPTLARMTDDGGASGSLKVVANLPYQITGPMIARLLRCWHLRLAFERLVVMVQKEVAERMQAQPGTSDYSAFSLLVQFFCRSEVVSTVPSGAFHPRPGVASAVVRLMPGQTPLPRRLHPGFFRLTRAGFNQRRKTLPNAVSGAPRLDLEKAAVQEAMESCDLDPRQRAETLSVDDFAALARRLQDRLPTP